MDIQENNENNIKFIDIPEPKEEIVYQCENCLKEYKSKSGLSKHLIKCVVEPEIIEEIFDEEPDMDDSRKMKLQNELKTLVLNNPTSIDLTKEVGYNHLESIYNMDVNELEARIFDAKLTFNKKIDSKVADSALSLTNQIVGGLLGCVNELEYEVSKDEILREATKDLLSFRILNYIPIEMKVSGLYSLNVATAMKKNKLKIQKQKELLKSQEIIEE
jgi:hypothetical protein